MTPPSYESADESIAPAVRPGHRRAVEYLASPTFAAVKQHVEDRLGVAVYFRPTASGVIPVLVDGPRPMGGVPSLPRIASGTARGELDQIEPPGIDGEGGGYPEAALEAALIRDALASRLQLHGLGHNLRFLHSQWRLGSAERIDLVGVDVDLGRLFIAELKPASDLRAFAQVRDYRDRIQERLDEFVPLFTDLAAAMAKLYAADDVAGTRIAADAVDAYVAWPADDGHLDVYKLDRTIGPQAPHSDTLWKARMRLHQSSWRASVRDVPHGIGPDATGVPRGNMLTPASAAAGKNFLTDATFEVAEKYTLEKPRGVERYRTLHNLLSSQPMAFNLFAPLRDGSDRARRLLDALVPDGVSEVEHVKFEWKPEDHPLNDGTAFDVFIRYLDTDGGRRFLGVETKLTEPFSQDPVRNESRYRELVAQMPDIWAPGGREFPLDVLWFQLLRNHLLVEYLAARGTYGRGRAVMVGHPLDPDLRAALDAYRALLTDPDRLLVLDVEAITHRWNGLDLDSETSAWLSEFRQRYVDLDASEPHWREFLGAAPAIAGEGSL